MASTWNRNVDLTAVGDTYVNQTYNSLRHYTRDDKFFIQSLPIKVFWDGWESTTTALQRHGWQLAVEQDIYRDGIRLIMKHEKHRIYALSETVNIKYYQNMGGLSNFDALQHIIIPVARASSSMHIELMERSFDFKPIDAETVYHNRPRKSIEDFAIFAPALVKTNEIFVPTDSVDSLLSKILEMQDPMLKKYYREEALKEHAGKSISALPEHKFVAQIISLDRRVA